MNSSTLSPTTALCTSSPTTCSWVNRSADDVDTNDHAEPDGKRTAGHNGAHNDVPHDSFIDCRAADWKPEYRNANDDELSHAAPDAPSAIANPNTVCPTPARRRQATAASPTTVNPATVLTTAAPNTEPDLWGQRSRARPQRRRRPRAC